MIKNNGQINNKNKLNNEKNNNYNSINSSNNLINKDNKFSSFLSRLNSYRKPLFLKIISSSIKNDTNKKNEFENKMDFAREPGRTKPLPFFSPTALSVHFVYSHCLPILMSPIQEQTVAMLQGHPNVRS